MPARLRNLLTFAAGLALGAATVAILLPSGSTKPRLGPSVSSPALAATPSAGFLRLPPPLSAVEAAEALAAYLALPPLAKDSPASLVEERLTRLRALLTVLPLDRFAFLLDALALRDGNPETRLRRAAFEIWTEQDAPAAARWALAFSTSETFPADERTRFLRQSVLAWARDDDFDAAYHWCNSIPEPHLARDLLSRLLVQLAAAEPERALALARARAGDPTLLASAEPAIFEAWAEKDPAAALLALGPALRQNPAQRSRLDGPLLRWIAKDPARALDWMLAQAPLEDAPHRTILDGITWQITRAPDAALPFLEVLRRRPDFPGRNQAVQGVVNAWIQEMPAPALAWLRTVPDLAERADLAVRAGYFVSTRHPEFLRDLLALVPSSDVKDLLIDQKFSAWAREDPEAAASWLAQNPDPALARAAAKVEGTLVAELAKTDPAAALARWEKLPPETASHHAAIELAKNWSALDPAAATRWLGARLPSDSAIEGRGHDSDHNLLRELQNLGARWAERDPLAFVQWAASLPVEAHRDHALGAIGVLASGYRGFDDPAPDPPPPAAIADQLGRVSDPALRARVLREYLEPWLRDDRPAAEAWINASDALIPEDAASLLSIRRVRMY